MLKFVFLIAVTVMMCTMHWTDAQCCLATKQFEISVKQDIVLAELAFDVKTHKVGYRVSSSDYKVIMLSNKTMIYVYTIVGSVCEKEIIAGPLPGLCTPSGAQNVSSVSLGNNALLVDIFRWNMSAPELYNVMHYAATRDGCIPVFVSDAMQIQSESTFFGALYFNFTEGIKDPDSWFKVPSICNDAPEQFDKDKFGGWQRFRKTFPFIV